MAKKYFSIINNGEEDLEVKDAEAREQISTLSFNLVSAGVATLPDVGDTVTLTSANVQSACGKTPEELYDYLSASRNVNVTMPNSAVNKARVNVGEPFPQTRYKYILVDLETNSLVIKIEKKRQQLDGGPSSFRYVYTCTVYIDEPFYTKTAVENKLQTKSNINHNHDSSYSALGHTHDDRYYQKSQVYTKDETQTYVNQRVGLEYDAENRCVKFPASSVARYDSNSRSINFPALTL